jgi:glucose/arabinose dehydrogenase
MRAALAAALVLLALPATSSAAPSLVPVETFSAPVHVAAPPGDAARLFVVEQAGRVQLVVNGQRAATPFLDIATSVSSGGERGLLSIAFPHDYATSGLFYVFYTDLGGDLVIREGQRSAADANRGALGRVLFTVEHSSASNHNGGQLAFGPDGALYVGTGDGGDQGDPGDDAQRMDSLLGKILRVDPRVSPNPQIWALGLRNPWRFSFDRVTGDMVIGDVGGGINEEVDFAPAGTPAGRNYGWVRCEGNQPTCPPGTIRPALNLAHPEYTGVIGGFVVRDPGLPTLLGRYVFGDLSKTTVMSAVVAAGGGSGLRPETALSVSGASSFGEDGCGHVHVASLNGPVSRIQDGALGPCVVPPPPPPPPGTGSPGGGPPTSPVADTTPCALKVAPTKGQRILRRGKRLRLTLRASERCTVTLRAKRFRTKQVSLQPNAKRIVRLTPTKQGLRKLRRALARSDRRRVRITVRISSRDDAGNRSTARVRRTVR